MVASEVEKILKLYYCVCVLCLCLPECCGKYRWRGSFLFVLMSLYSSSSLALKLIYKI